MTLGPLMVDVAGPVLTAAEADLLRHPLVGGVILFSRNYENPGQLRLLTDAIHAVRSPPLLIAVDQEGGRVQRFREGFRALPPLRWLGHQYDLDEARGRRLAQACGFIMAAEVLATGVDLSFAPVVDLDYGHSEVIGDRAFHRQPDAVAALALAYLQGMRRAGMVAVAKHFPGHGFVVADSHLELPVDPRSRQDLADELLPYSRLIDHGLGGIMVAHVRFPAVDPAVASLSWHWLQAELRGNLGFRGVIFSDDLTMKALGGSGDVPERVRRALGAGADMALVCNDAAAAEDALVALGAYANPAGQARLVSLRPHPDVRRTPEDLWAAADWQQAVVDVEEALARPTLALN